MKLITFDQVTWKLECLPELRNDDEAFWKCPRCGAEYPSRTHSACEQCKTTLVPRSYCK